MLHIRPKAHGNAWRSLVAFAALFAAPFLIGQTVILSSDFTGRTISGNTFSNITWTGSAATSSTTSLQAIRIDNNGTQVRSIDAGTAGNAGYLTVASQNATESWIIDVTFTATAGVSAAELSLKWASANNGQMASPGFGFALYHGSAPSSNLNLTPFGGGSNAVGYAITGTVQPSGTGALSSAMTGNVPPVDAHDLTASQAFSLSLSNPVALTNGDTYVLRIGIFENNNSSYNPNIYLDSVTLSTSAIPEPGTYAALVGLGTLGFAVWRRRRA